MVSTIHPSHLDFEIDHPSSFAPYLIDNPAEIFRYLERIRTQRTLVKVFLDDGEAFFVSTLLDVAPAAGEIQLDPAPDDSLNIAIQACRRITLSARLDGVQIQARVTEANLVSRPSGRFLRCPAPTLALRLQRRGYFRLAPPASDPIDCRICLPGKDGSQLDFTLHVSDISAGGLSLIVPPLFINQCRIDDVFSDCRLDLGSEGVLLVNLRVRKITQEPDDLPRNQHRLGCEFHELALSRQSLIDRYVARVDRERKARSSGLRD